MKNFYLSVFFFTIYINNVFADFYLKCTDISFSSPSTEYLYIDEKKEDVCNVSIKEKARWCFTIFYEKFENNKIAYQDGTAFLGGYSIEVAKKNKAIIDRHTGRQDFYTLEEYTIPVPNFLKDWKYLYSQQCERVNLSNIKLYTLEDAKRDKALQEWKKLNQRKF